MQISDASTGAVLSTQTVSSFQSGVYLDYAVSGNVVITITRQAGDNAVLSGLFLDPTATTAATFLKQDTTTQGTWIGTYGAAGLRRHRRLVQPAELRHGHPVGPDELRLGGVHDRPPRLQTVGRFEPDRRDLVLDDQLHGGREPDRRPGARPGAVLPRLGLAGPHRAGADQRREHRRGAEHADGLVVPVGGVPRLRGQREHRDHDHQAGRRRTPCSAACSSTPAAATAHVPQAGHDDAGDLDRDLRRPGLRRHRRLVQPAELRHGHPLGPDELRLGVVHDRPPRPADARRLEPDRRRLVLRRRASRWTST